MSNTITVHPDDQGTALTLVPDETKFTVRFGTDREPLSRETKALLQDRSEPVAQFPRYGIRVFEGPSRDTRDRAVDLLNAEPAVDNAAPVLHRHTRDGDEVYVTRTVLVQFEAGVPRSRIDEVLASFNATVIEPLGYAHNGFKVLAAATTDGLGALHLAEALRDTGLVIFAHADLVSTRHRRSTATLERHTAVAPRDATLQSQQWHLAHAKVTDAWTITRGDSGIYIAILDDGVDVDHVEFAGRVVAQHDFTDDVDDARPKTADDKHGTACTGVALAGGVNASGSAPECSIVAVRYPSALGDSDEATMFQWAADQRADVISCSWGPADGTGQADPLPGATQAAIRYCLTSGRDGKGIPILWAAGNGDESVDLDGYAANPDVIAVAASTNESTRSWYSDKGAALWISAPSSGDRQAGQKSITTTDRTGSPGYNDGNQGVSADYTNTFGGTSSATPLVAGIVGLMLSVNPDLTHTDVRNILRDTARKVGSGYDAAGHSTEFGYGLVDACAAVKAAQAAVGGGATPGRPSIVGPQQADRGGMPPQFQLNPAAGASIYWHVEVATEAQLLDGGDHGDDPRFYATWVSEPFGATSSWTMPHHVWEQMCAAEALYYRAFFSSSSTSWENVVATLDNENWSLAPSVQLVGGNGGGASTDTVGTITGPDSVTRGGDGPGFEVTAAPGSANRYYAVEFAADPALFDGASHSLDDGFYGSWIDSPFLTDAYYQMPSHIWDVLCEHDRLHYRAWFSASATSWQDTVVTTRDGDGDRSPSFAITPAADRSRTEDAAGRAHPEVTAPTQVRRGAAAPEFVVQAKMRRGSWVLEVASDPAEWTQPSATGASWRSEPIDVAVATTTVPAAQWKRLTAHDRLYYRVGTSPAAVGTPWYPQDWSTSPRLPEAAPWIEIIGARSRDAVLTPLTRDERFWRRNAKSAPIRDRWSTPLESGDHIWYYDGLGNSDAIEGEQVSTDINIPRLTWFPAADPHDPNDYRNNGIHIYHYVVMDEELRLGQPHLRNKPGSFAWLNNNPGNLTGVAGGPDFGQYYGKFSWHNFLVFPDYDTGFAAIGAFLQQGPYPNLSILEAFRKYAPAGDGGNRPDEYAAKAAAAADVSIDTLVGDLSSDELWQVQVQIEAIEGSLPGWQLTYDSEDIPEIVREMVLES